MSFQGRSFPDVGKKMLMLKPLGKQLVHPQDSVLGPLSEAKQKSGKLAGKTGLKTSYAAMIRKAFHDKYWNSSKIAKLENLVFHEPDLRDPRKFPIGFKKVTIIDLPVDRPLAFNEYTQMAANFSLFFGLAIQLYEATLIADDTPFDRYQEGKDNALTNKQKQGLDIFLKQGECYNCHGGSEFTNASVANKWVALNRVNYLKMQLRRWKWPLVKPSMIMGFTI